MNEPVSRAVRPIGVLPGDRLAICPAALVAAGLPARVAARLAAHLPTRSHPLWAGSIPALLALACLPAAMAQGSAAAASAAQPDASSVSCRADPSRPDRLLASSPGLTLAIVPERWPIPVGQHFSVELTVCADRPAAALPSLLGLDADMPLHRHGMNYRASIEPLGAGRYRAQGLMFHMPGRWRFTAELAEPGGATRRLALDVDVP